VPESRSGAYSTANVKWLGDRPRKGTPLVIKQILVKSFEEVEEVTNPGLHRVLLWEAADSHEDRAVTIEFEEVVDRRSDDTVPIGKTYTCAVTGTTGFKELTDQLNSVQFESWAFLIQEKWCLFTQKPLVKSGSSNPMNAISAHNSSRLLRSFTHSG